MKQSAVSSWRCAKEGLTTDLRKFDSFKKMDGQSRMFRNENWHTELAQIETSDCLDTTTCRHCPRIGKAWGTNWRRAEKANKANKRRLEVETLQKEMEDHCARLKKKRRTRWNWCWRFENCEQAKVDEAATHLSRLTGVASTQPHWSKSVRWEQRRRGSKCQ